MPDRQLDVLFVAPNSAQAAYQGLAEDYVAVEPPTWALILAQSCRAKGFGAFILDCNAAKLTDKEAVTMIGLLKPRLAVFVVYGSEPNAGTKNMAGAVPLCDLLKQTYPEIKTCFCGTHTQALPLEVLSIPSVDFVLQNEGVYALHALLLTDLENGLGEVWGIGWKESWEHKGMTSLLPRFDYHLNPIGRIVPQERMDLDMPGHAWDLLPKRERFLDLYRSHFWHSGYVHEKRTPFAAVYSSLGCPFKCGFCVVNNLNRTDNRPGATSADFNTFRYWSHTQTLWEIDCLMQRGVRTIRFSDEMFFLDKRHYSPLLDGLIERNKDGSLNLWAYARVDTVRVSDLPRFRKAGFRWLAIGIESANRTVRRQADKSGSWEEVDIRRVVREIEGAGIEVIANYIAGLPGDSKDGLEESLNLACELNTAMYNIYPAMALPGTPLYEEAKRSGVKLPETWSGFSFHGYDCQPLPTEHLTAAEVLRFRDEAFQRYWSRPEFLSMIQRKFGDAARENIEVMLKVKLKRKLLGD